MASNSTVNYDNIVNSPLENGMLTVEEFVNDKAKPYAETSFINCQRIPYGDNLRIEGQLNRLMQIGDYIARVDIHVPKAGDQDAQKSKWIDIRPKFAGIVTNPYVINSFHNNRIDNKKYNVSYEFEIQEAISRKKYLMKIDFDDISNDNIFKSKVKTLSNLSSAEIAEFIGNFVTKNNPKNITEYRNSGRIDIEGNMNWIWENCAYIRGKMHYADEYGNIPLTDNNYIRVVNRSRMLLPVYHQNSKSIEQVITDLFDNIFESWNGAIEPFLAISFIAMSPYCPEFWDKEGFGAIAFVGDTEVGKTEITGLGLALFGFNKFFMGTTRNTLVGVEQKMNAVNCIPVIIDDISKLKLSGDNFCEELKRLMYGRQRDKGLNGQESGALPPCCPFGFSSNYIPSEKPEIMNRTLYLDTENVKFSPDKFNYFQGKAVKELSCILPRILDIGFETIDQIHTKIKSLLKEKYVGISDRMASQIAIALTGVEIFKKIANCELKFPTNKLNEYILNCMKRFEATQTPIDKLLEAMPILIWERRIQEGLQYKLDSDNLTVLTIHKTAICHAYNKYFESDSSKHINSRQIKNVNAESYKILKFNKTSDFSGEKHNSLVIDISNHPSRDDILANHQKITQNQSNCDW